MNDDTVSYAVIAGLIGETKALELSKKHGGRELFIPTPSRLGPHSPVVALIGMEAAEKLAQRFGGDRFDVPLGHGKRLRIWELRKKDRWTIARIAGEMRCTERTIYNVLAGPRPAALDAPPDNELPPLLAYLSER